MNQSATTAEVSELPRFLTVKEAAQELNTSPSHIYRSVEAGHIPHKRIGRAVRIPRSYIETLDAE